MKEFQVNKNIAFAMMFYIFMWILSSAASFFSLSLGSTSMWIFMLVLGMLFIFIFTLNITLYPKKVFIDKQSISLQMHYSSKMKINISKNEIKVDKQKGLYILRYTTENNLRKSYYIREKNIPQELKNILSKMIDK